MQKTLVGLYNKMSSWKYFKLVTKVLDTLLEQLPDPYEGLSNNQQLWWPVMKFWKSGIVAIGGSYSQIKKTYMTRTVSYEL